MARTPQAYRPRNRSKSDGQISKKVYPKLSPRLTAMCTSPFLAATMDKLWEWRKAEKGGFLFCDRHCGVHQEGEIKIKRYGAAPAFLSLTGIT
jgi:hypothetical protein